MAKKYLDKDGLLYVWQKAKNAFVSKDGTKVLSDNNYTTTEKTKLAGIEEGATKTVVDAALDTSSTNPVQNKVVQTALNTKVDKVSGKGLSTNDYTTDEKNKLAGISPNATRVVVDSSLSSSSTNAIENKAVYNALSKKVDAVSGKGLSTNDFTDDLKELYDETVETVAELTATGGEANKVNDVKVNGTSVVSDKIANITVPTKTSDLNNDSGFITSSAISNKADKGTTLADYGITDAKINGQNVILGAATLTVPTNNNQLTNGAGYQTASQVESKITAKGYQTEDQVNALIASGIADITGIEYTVTPTLPSVGEPGVIYLVANNGTNPNIYDEYIYVNNKFEKIGTTDVDLSGYLQETDLEAITNSEIDTIVSS